MLDFTAIDFETANSYRGSPCSVGLVRVRDGHPVEERHWLVRPPEGADWFDPWNVSIHGISAEMVAEAPRWRDVLPHIVEFIGDDVVVAHNAGFDIGVIRYACAIDNIEWPEMRFLCTLVMSRRALALPTYRLPYVAESLGIPMNNHHNALEDALAVCSIVVGLSRNHGAADLDGLALSCGVNVGRMSSGIYRGSVVTSGGGNNSLTRGDLNPDADPAGYLYGRVVVFTGALASMTRQVAWDHCSRVGAIPDKNTTKRTNVLVVGDINPAVLRPNSNLTGKARKAFELQDAGQAIEVMTEDDFVRCLDGEALDGNTSPFDISILLDEKVTQDEHSPQTTVGEEKRPKPLRREPIATDQTCSTDGCTSPAAFKTRSKPTWCVAHVEAMQRRGGIRPLESFTHPEDWQLTECLNCGVRAHYRFVYTLDKNNDGETTCRACFWRGWAAAGRRMGAIMGTSTTFPEAELIAEKHGYQYLGPLTVPSLGGEPHHVKCTRCGRISAERTCDIEFGCPCRR